MNEQAVRNIESALGRAAFETSAILYRPLEREFSDLIRAFLLDGGEAIQPGTFQSAFTERTVADELATSDTGPAVVLNIQVPLGTPAIDLRQFPFGSQIRRHEIILPRSITYLVDCLQKGGGKLYAHVTAERPQQVTEPDVPPVPTGPPKKIFTERDLPADPVIVDYGVVDRWGWINTEGTEPHVFLQIGPGQYIRVGPGPVLDRRLTKVQMLAKRLTIEQYIDQGRLFSSGVEAELGFLQLYMRDADGYYVIVYPPPEIEPGDFEILD